jgi:hypothetical protein
MIKQLLKLFFVAALLFYVGCDEEEENNPPPPPPPEDTTVEIYNNLLISERTIPFDLAFSAVDLYAGVIVQDSSSIKDANLIDSLFAGDSVFYFRSGELSDEFSVPGFQTKFLLVSQTATQDEFDSLIAIPDLDTLLLEENFPDNTTGSFGAPLVFNSVYGFYLKGKYDMNITPYKVFGLLYLEFAYYDTQGFKLRFDVKINKIGKNIFKSQ